MFSKEKRFFDKSLIKATGHLWDTNDLDFEKV